MVLFLTYFYSPVLFHPSAYLMGDTGDAIKNYFSYEWHVQNDTSFVNYTGTNYPFGEQHIYTDGNPLLSNLVCLLPFLKDYSIAIFNLSLLFSIILTALMLFNIFREFKVANGFSIIASTGIAILSPQSLRLHGHFTLSYSFFIPLIIYLLILFETKEQKTKYNILISLVILCSFFVHPYMGMILTSVVFLYHIIKLVVKVFSPFFKGRKSAVADRGVLPFLGQSVLPIAIYFAYVKLTDTHTNRTSHPYGFLFFIARIESVFVSSMPPFRHMLSQIIKIHEQNWEGLAYVGISSLFAILCLPFLLYFKRKRLKSFVQENKNVAVLLILSLGSILLLFFSMGYPFKWGMESLLDSVPFINQFRSPGRFAWVFYFTTTIASTILLSNYFLPKMNFFLRGILVSAILLLFAVEGFPFHKRPAENAFVMNCFDKNGLDDEMKQVCAAITKMQAQAIVPLPFFHVGTDYFSINGTEKIKTTSFIAAFHSKTPILGSCTDRTSLDEAKASIQIVTSSLIKKDLAKFIGSRKPFCILYSKEKLQEGEEALLVKGKTILETANYLVKELSANELLSDEIAKRKEFYSKNKASLRYLDGSYLSDSSYVKSLSLDDQPGKQLTGRIEKECILLDIPQNILEKERMYEVSFWYDLKNENELTNEIVAKEITVSGDSIRVLAERKCGQMPNVAGNKVLVALSFKTADSQNKIRIYLKGNREYKGSFTLDDLLLRRKDVDIYKMKFSADRKDSVLTLNNFELR